MAGRADFDVQGFAQCRLGLERVAAGTRDFDFFVFRMDIGFHLGNSSGQIILARKNGVLGGRLQKGRYYPDFCLTWQWLAEGCGA